MMNPQNSSEPGTGSNARSIRLHLVAGGALLALLLGGVGG